MEHIKPVGFWNIFWRYILLVITAPIGMMFIFGWELAENWYSSDLWEINIHKEDKDGTIL